MSMDSAGNRGTSIRYRQTVQLSKIDQIKRQDEIGKLNIRKKTRVKSLMKGLNNTSGLRKKHSGMSCIWIENILDSVNVKI